MKHTDKYQFSLIDTDDTFSPEPLNRNTQALETELARVEAAAAAESGRVNAALNTKAAQTALTAEAAAREALAARVTALDAGRLRCKYGTYKGNGASSIQLNFDFKPLLVVVSHQSSTSRGGFPWIWGAAMGMASSADSALAVVKLTWGARSLSLSYGYGYGYGSSPGDWMNDSSTTYCYFAVGLVE